jgi:hypothetical protein
MIMRGARSDRVNSPSGPGVKKPRRAARMANGRSSPNPLRREILPERLERGIVHIPDHDIGGLMAQPGDGHLAIPGADHGVVPGPQREDHGGMDGGIGGDDQDDRHNVTN